MDHLKIISIVHSPYGCVIFYRYIKFLTEFLILTFYQILYGPVPLFITCLHKIVEQVNVSCHYNLPFNLLT